MVFDERTVTKQAGENTLINMDSLTQLVAGNVIVYVTSLASSGDYFNSQTGEVDIVKLDSSEITIANGLLEWNTINNSKQYNLVYSNASGSGTVVLVHCICKLIRKLKMVIDII